jgi:hypothetical protein
MSADWETVDRANSVPYCFRLFCVTLIVVMAICAAKRDRVYCAQALLDILEEPAPSLPAALPSE